MEMPGVLRRLVDATNAHDLGALVECFTDDFVSETPTHPDRSFTGSEQVRRNWSRIFDGVPDLNASVTRWSRDGDTVWAEWEQHGTRRDGLPHEMHGVAIFGVDGERFRWVRFYLEPVVRDGLDATDAVRHAMSAKAGTP